MKLMHAAILDEGGCILGTGALVGPRHILTAKHVVENAGPLLVTLGISDNPTMPPVSADVGWTSSEYDAALLLVDNIVDPAISPLLLLHLLVSFEPCKWEAWAYAEASPVHLQNKALHLAGNALSCGPTQTHVDLDGTVGVKIYQGASGAAIVSGGRIIAIIHQQEHWGRERVQAVPVARLLVDLQFRKALNLPDLHEEVAACLRRLGENARRLLEEFPWIACLIGPRVGVTNSELGEPDRETVARALLETDARACVTALDLAYMDPGATTRAKRAISDFIMSFLPYTVDYQALVVHGRTRLEAAQLIDLPLRTRAVAELVIAGVEGRACEFIRAPNGSVTSPAALEVPGALEFVIDPDKKKLVDELVRLVAGRHGVDPEADVVDAFLEAQAEEAADRRRLGSEGVKYSYYFVYRSTEGSAEAWTISLNEVSHRLGSLKLVCLTPDPQRTKQEIHLETRLRKYARAAET